MNTWCCLTSLQLTSCTLQLISTHVLRLVPTGPSLRMFDAVAGWLVKRVRARHVQAPSSPQQLAAVAAAYARLQHRSVVVPELLTALDLQVSKQAEDGRRDLPV